MTPMVPLKSRLSGAIKGKFETIRFIDIVQPLLFFFHDLLYVLTSINSKCLSNVRNVIVSS